MGVLRVTSNSAPSLLHAEVRREQHGEWAGYILLDVSELQLIPHLRWPSTISRRPGNSRLDSLSRLRLRAGVGTPQCPSQWFIRVPYIRISPGNHPGIASKGPRQYGIAAARVSEIAA